MKTTPTSPRSVPAAAPSGVATPRPGNFKQPDSSPQPARLSRHLPYQIEPMGLPTRLLEFGRPWL